MSICDFRVQLLSAFLDVVCKLHINYALSHNCRRISLSKFQSSFCNKRVCGGGGGSGDHNAQEFLEEVQQLFRKKQHFRVQLLSAFLDVVCKLHINYVLLHNCRRIFLSIWVSDFCFFDQHISLSKFQSFFCSKRVRGGGGGSGDHNAQEFLEEVQQQFRKKQQRSETTTPA
jgi:hypothetical protein